MTVTWSKATGSIDNGNCVEIGWSKSSLSESNGACVEIGQALDYFKSSYSSETANCVEVADATGSVFVRDTKNRDKGTLEFSKDSFTNFVQAIKSGEFDK